MIAPQDGHEFWRLCETRLERVKRTGAEYAFSCPNSSAHKNGDRNASASANPSKGDYGVWNCHGCPAKGSLWGLAETLGLDFERPQRHERPVRPPVAEGKPCANLSERGVLPATAQRLGITETDERIYFPVLRPDGSLAGVKYRLRSGIPDKYKWEQSSDFPLFGHWPTIRANLGPGLGFMYLVEGFMDCIALTQAAAPTVCPIHGAGKYPEGVISELAALKWLDLIFIFAQNDSAGLDFAAGWRERLRGLWPDDDAEPPYSIHVSVIVTPPGVDGREIKDPADALEILGPERFRAWAWRQRADYEWKQPVRPLQIRGLVATEVHA